MNYKDLVIKNIIFDLGNVIIEVDENKTANFLKTFDYDYNNIKEKLKNTIINFELGMINSTEFISTTKKVCPSLSEKQIKEAWLLMLKPISYDTFKLLENLKKHYKIFVLSNTNELHYEYFSKQFEKDFKTNFRNFFDNVFLSFEIKLRKPDLNIFKYIIDKTNIKPEETIFIDDIPENLATSKILGFNTLQIEKNIFKEKEKLFFLCEKFSHIE